MEIPTYILLVLACLGATDILLFHSVAHGIRSHPESAKELFTHSVRGPTYAALFVLVPNFAMHGLFAWGLVGLFIVDVGISVWDFSIEQDSRRFLGGLPGGEYVLHMLMAIAFGGLVAAFLFGAVHWFSLPTRLDYAPAQVPGILRLALFMMSILVLASGIQDAVAAIRLGRRAGNIAGTRAGLSRACQSAEHAYDRSIPAKWTGAAVSSASRSTGWMRAILVTAGIYNLLWGTWVVLMPAALFRWAGMAPANYPQIWQCVGMIVGAYGVGYLIAARDPFRHWPIVLVGLLGKLLGPAGMVWSLTRGSLPARMGWVCLGNDVIWWVPFAAILTAAFVSRQRVEKVRRAAAHFSNRSR